MNFILTHKMTLIIMIIMCYSVDIFYHYYYYIPNESLVSFIHWNSKVIHVTMTDIVSILYDDSQLIVEYDKDISY